MRSTVVVLVGLVLLLQRPAPAQTYLVVVSGLAGDPSYAATLHEWAASLVDAARAQLGLPASHVLYLADRPDEDPTRIAARSTKENIERELRELAQRAESDADVMIVLLGHGSHRNGQSRFNLPGPDLTAEDFAELLGLFATQRVAFINTASASGAFLPVLSGERRVIMTATKSGDERNQTVFGRFLIEAFVDGGADVDKDRQVSLLEAFQYARSHVARTYEEQNRLLTEHAQLDDNGDGIGTTEPGSNAPDGSLAQHVYLGGGPAAVTRGDPELAPLYERKEGIERRLVTLRREKDNLAPEVYELRLEELLLELAETTRRIRELERGSRDE